MWLFFGCHVVLEFQKFPGCGGQDLSASGVNRDVIFNPDAADPLHIYARLDRNDHPSLKLCFLVLGQPGRFVNLKPQAVSGAVYEVLAKPRGVQYASCCCVWSTEI